VADAIREFEDNVEAADAWNGPLFDVWIEYRDIVAEGLREHGETAIARGIGCPALRPGPVLDGERGHGQRHPQARGLRGRPPGPARPPYKIGKDLEHAVAFNMALGPAAESFGCGAIAWTRSGRRSPTSCARVLSDYETDDGSVVAPSSTWAITARAPR
jgi:hypothetical protein